MANNIGGRPWVIDTASASVVKSGNVYVKTFVFSGYASAIDQCVITADDGRGNRITVCVLNGTAELQPVSFSGSLPFWVRELAVTVLTNGLLQVFV